MEPNFHLARLKNKISQGEPVIGTMVSFSDMAISELLAYIGYDFIWVETEHTAMTTRETQQHIVAIQGAGAAAFVRVPWNDPVLVKPILDMGADGIIFPMVRTADEAKRAVEACLYPPTGVRGYGPIRASRYGMIGQKDYLENYDCWKIMQIEHVDAVANLDEILAVEGVDAILVGVNDLSASIGRLDQPDHPEVKELISSICRSAKKAGKPFAAALYHPTGIQEWIEMGINWIVVGSDLGFLKTSAENSINVTRQLWKGVRHP